MHQRAKHFLDWLFKDYNGRHSGYVIVETPNLPLIVFMVCIVIAVVAYPGFWQTSFAFLAYVALVWWGYLELRSGRSRFRRYLGWGAMLAVVGALVLRLGF